MYSSMEGLTQINPDSIATADAGGIDAEDSVFISAGLYVVTEWTSLYLGEVGSRRRSYNLFV